MVFTEKKNNLIVVGLMMNANVFVLIMDYFFLIMEVIKKYYWLPSSQRDQIASQMFNIQPLFWYIARNKLMFWWYILKQLFTLVSVKVVDIYLHFPHINIA